MSRSTVSPINITISAGRSEEGITGSRIMSREKRRNKRLMHQINTALARGAEITIDWLTSLIVVAKKEWHIRSFNRFKDHLGMILKKRGFEYQEDVEHVLRNCWRTVTA